MNRWQIIEQLLKNISMGLEFTAQGILEILDAFTKHRMVANYGEYLAIS